LVVLPFESAPLTKPVAQLKSKGVYVTVVDRGLTDTSAQDAYVAGDNRTFAKISGEYLAKAFNGKGDIVVLRGIPTTIDNERDADLFELFSVDKGASRPWFHPEEDILRDGEVQFLVNDGNADRLCLRRVSETKLVSAKLDDARIRPLRAG
jgi:substrate-binding family protein